MRAPHHKLKRTKNRTHRNRRQGAPPHKVQSNRNRNHSENKPAARRLDGTGCTSTSEMPRPTVSPIETEMSWRAVWKPDKYDSFVDDPDFNVLNHIHVRRLPEPAGKRELDALVSHWGARGF